MLLLAVLLCLTVGVLDHGSTAASVSPGTDAVRGAAAPVAASQPAPSAPSGQSGATGAVPPKDALGDLAAPQQGVVSAFDGFETGDFSLWDSVDDNPQIVSSDVRSGSYAAQLTAWYDGQSHHRDGLLIDFGAPVSSATVDVWTKVSWWEQAWADIYFNFTGSIQRPFWTWSQTGGYFDQSTFFAHSLPMNQWNHERITYDATNNNTLTFYENGVAQLTLPNYATSVTGFTIHTGGSGIRFLLDDVSYSFEPAPPPPPPAWRFPFDDNCPNAGDVCWTLGPRDGGVHKWSSANPDHGGFELSGLDFVANRRLDASRLGSELACGDTTAPYPWVYPAAKGWVASTDFYRNYGNGRAFATTNYIELRHEGTLLHTAYYHLTPSSALTAAQLSGQDPILPQQALGKASCATGLGGYANRAHVHFGVVLPGADGRATWLKIAGDGGSEPPAVKLCGWSPTYNTTFNGLTGSHDIAGGSQEQLACDASSNGIRTASQVAAMTQSLVQQLPFSVQASARPWISFILLYANSQITLGLQSPSGPVDLLTACAVHETGQGFEYCRIPAPEQGSWTAILAGVDVPTPEDAVVNLVEPRCADPVGVVVGDPCSENDDGDAVADAADNCPFDINADQLDTNGNGIGNVCDAQTAVGGIAEQPDVTALPSAAASSGRNHARYILGAAVALIVAAAGAAGWRKRRAQR
ncbi:MAG: hypothetical protein HY874_01370 [Chloroflexi bacterium]|nr:hypothetical protein [Chloroflexota bacterium]